MIPFIGIKKLERGGRTYLVIRDPHGVDHTVPAPFKPYAFVRGNGSDLRDLDGKPVRKVEFDLPSALGAWARAMANKGIQTYEADIPYVRRVTTDRGWQMAFNAKIASVDIETDDSKGFPVPTRDRILSVAIVKSDGTELWFNDSDECTLLRNTIHTLKDVAIAIGWNSGDWERGFDFPYIRIRAEACGINAEKELWHLGFVDIMKEYRAQFRPKRLTLDYVAKLEGLGGKVERDKPVYMMSESELRDYNITDARLVMELEKKYGFASILLEKMRLSYQPVVTTGTIRVVDTLVLRKAREMGYVLPTTPDRGDDSYYRGALVLDPVPGLHKNVAVYDINSLYPSIILFERVSPDKERRLFPDIIKELMEKRFEYKRLWKETGEWDYYVKQYAYKILMNSFYGAIGNPGFRLHNKEMAEFITSKGREILGKISGIAQRFGKVVIYGDTDSIFIEGIPLEKAEAFERLVNRMIAPYSVKLDKYFLAVLFPGREGERIKKRYAGITSDGDLVIMGLEVVRGDWPEFVKEFEEELVKRILAIALGKGTKEEIEAFIEETGRALYRGEFDEKLVITKSLSKSEYEYKVDAPHLKVLRILRRHGIDVSHLGVVEYYWVRNGRGRQPWPAQLPLDGKRIDYDHYWSLALNKVDVLAGTIGIDYRRFKAMSNRSLMDFLRKPKQ